MNAAVKLGVFPTSTSTISTSQFSTLETKIDSLTSMLSKVPKQFADSAEYTRQLTDKQTTFVATAASGATFTAPPPPPF